MQDYTAYLVVGFVAVSSALVLSRRPSPHLNPPRVTMAAPLADQPPLFAEEYDVDQRQLRGNLPQAFVHALLLESSVRLGDAG